MLALDIPDLIFVMGALGAATRDRLYSIHGEGIGPDRFTERRLTDGRTRELRGEITTSPTQVDPEDPLPPEAARTRERRKVEAVR
jgi:hypothetical protein